MRQRQLQHAVLCHLFRQYLFDSTPAKNLQFHTIQSGSIHQGNKSEAKWMNRKPTDWIRFSTMEKSITPQAEGGKENEPGCRSPVRSHREREWTWRYQHHPRRGRCVDGVSDGHATGNAPCLVRRRRGCGLPHGRLPACPQGPPHAARCGRIPQGLPHAAAGLR